MTMKVGVLTFGYDGFEQFGRQVSERGFFTANLGDNMQSIAVRRALASLGVAPEDIVSIDRDTARHYDGPPVMLVMNGVFPARSLPLPPQIRPLFVGYSALPGAVAAHRDYLARFAPIGCRDPATTQSCRDLGIPAFTTGCLTLTLPPRLAEQAATADKVLAIYGAGAGAFPSTLLKLIPASLLDRMEFVSQRQIQPVHPLDATRRDSAERVSMDLLAMYAREARLVITPLHHAAAPCMAMGIPVIVARDSVDWRFGLLDELVTVHTPDSFADIDWAPAPVPMAEIRQQGLGHLARALACAGMA